jgi:hypothetical protein
MRAPEGREICKLEWLSSLHIFRPSGALDSLLGSFTLDVSHGLHSVAPPGLKPGLNPAHVPLEKPTTRWVGAGGSL